MTSLISMASASPPVTDLLARFRVAQTLRQPMEGVWRDCLEYTLPYRNENGSLLKNMKLFDGTAGDAVDQLASSLLAQLTPPWSSWIAVAPGPVLSDTETAAIAPRLREVNEILQGHLDRSNFAVEMHQAFLDLVTLGTACLRFDETAPGDLSAFHFQSLPLRHVAFLDSARGQLDASFYQMTLSADEILERFPHAADSLREAKTEQRHTILYAVTPHAQGGYTLSFILDPDNSDPVLLEQIKSPTSPFIAFRWQKSAGEIYGRSPVMKALPDIKTANKVVD